MVEVICHHCENKTQKTLRTYNQKHKLFKHPKFFCDRKCFHDYRRTEKGRNEVRDKHVHEPKINKTCILGNCHNTWELNWKTRKKKYCSNACANKGQKGKSKKNRVKRSRNEKYFADLCEIRFNNVLTNVPMFNGWDADVIIEDIKMAILWNGRWHYEKIMEGHSLKQVQNRDRLKIIEIKKLGYVPYIIKDMGKANNKFVEEQFNIFMKGIGTDGCSTVSYAVS